MKSSFWLTGVGILLFGILASKCLSLYFNEISLPIFLTALTIAFGYIQYQLSKKHTEERRFNDLQISAYNNLTAQANTILEECSKVLILLHPNSEKEDRRITTNIAITLAAKFSRLTMDIDFFSSLLDIKIDKRSIDEADEIISEVLEEMDVSKGVEYYSNIYAKIHGKIGGFASDLSKEILRQKKETKSGF